MASSGVQTLGEAGFFLLLSTSLLASPSFVFMLLVLTGGGNGPAAGIAEMVRGHDTGGAFSAAAVLCRDGGHHGQIPAVRVGAYNIRSSGCLERPKDFFDSLNGSIWSHIPTGTILNGSISTGGDRMKFSQIKELLLLRGMTQRETAERLGAGLSAYRRCEKGPKRMKVKRMIQLADLSGVSSDDLAGRSGPHA